MVMHLDDGLAEAADAVSLLYRLDIPTELARLRESYRMVFRPLLQHTGISHQYWRVMRALADAGPSEVTQISRASAVPPASLSRLLPRMENEGLIRRAWHARDKRRIVVELTAEGRAIQADMARIIRRGLAELVRSVDVDLMIDLGHRLRAANREMERLAATPPAR